MKAGGRLWAVVVLVAGAAVGLAWVAGFGACFTAAGRINPPRLGIIVGFEAVAYFSYGLAYQALFKIKYRLALNRTLAGFSPFIIRGGFTYDTHPPIGSRPKVARLLLWEYVALVPLAYAAAAASLATSYGVPRSFSVPWIIGVPLGAGLAALVVHQWWHLARVCRQLAVGLRLLPAMAAELKSLSGVVIVAGLAVYWAAEMAAVWAALLAYGVSLSIPAIVIGYATGYILSRRSLPLGGAGLVITFLTAALYFVGSPLAGALLAVFTYYLFSLLLPLLANMELRDHRFWYHKIDGR